MKCNDTLITNLVTFLKEQIFKISIDEACSLNHANLMTVITMKKGETSLPGLDLEASVGALHNEHILLHSHPLFALTLVLTFVNASHIPSIGMFVFHFWCCTCHFVPLYVTSKVVLFQSGIPYLSVCIPNDKLGHWNEDSRSDWYLWK